MQVESRSALVYSTLHYTTTVQEQDNHNGHYTDCTVAGRQYTTLRKIQYARREARCLFPAFSARRAGNIFGDKWLPAAVILRGDEDDICGIVSVVSSHSAIGPPCRAVRVGNVVNEYLLHVSIDANSPQCQKG